MAACNVTKKGTKRSGRRWCRQQTATRIGCGEEPGDQPNACRFHITLTAGHLACKSQSRCRTKAQPRIQELWRIEESVAVETSQSSEFGVLEPGDRPEGALLRAVFQFGLKTHHVVERAEFV